MDAYTQALQDRLRYYGGYQAPLPNQAAQAYTNRQANAGQSAMQQAMLARLQSMPTKGGGFNAMVPGAPSQAGQRVTKPEDAQRWKVPGASRYEQATGRGDYEDWVKSELRLNQPEPTDSMHQRWKAMEAAGAGRQSFIEPWWNGGKPTQRVGIGDFEQRQINAVQQNNTQQQPSTPAGGQVNMMEPRGGWERFYWMKDPRNLYGPTANPANAPAYKRSAGDEYGDSIKNNLGSIGSKPQSVKTEVIPPASTQRAQQPAQQSGFTGGFRPGGVYG